MNGILIVDKEKGMTSRDVVNQISKIFNTKKVGHTGTLDPIATGVLVILLGKYTKLTELLTSYTKEYYATMELGILTDTLDITGHIVKKEDVTVTEDDIRAAFARFPKEYDQTVPLYSAVKIAGQKLYEYARANKDVTLPQRRVHIYQLEIVAIDHHLVTFKCTVSKGTYIRSLIRDLALSLNTVATMRELRRTKQGSFAIDESYTLSDIANRRYELKDLSAVLDYDIIDMDDELAKKIYNGGTYLGPHQKDFILFRHHDEDIALYKYRENCYKMYLLLK